MSTIGEEIDNAEEKADKWFEKFRKHTLYFFLGCSLFYNVHLVRREDRKDAEHRRDMAEIRAELSQVRAKLEVTDRELKMSLDGTIMAQRKYLDLYERLYPNTPGFSRH